MNYLNLGLTIIIIIIFLKYIIFKEKIDIVYTWVENNHEFQQEILEYSKKENYKIEKGKYNDHYELKYSLRSLEKNLKGFNNIYIVVKDGQIPNYINFNHPKIKLINHSDIIPKEYLPTFNILSIECFLHHIPGLSNYYIYMNDDIIINNKIDIDFFRDNKKPYIPLTTLQSNRFFIKEELKQGDFNFSNTYGFNNYLLDYLTVKDNKRVSVSHVPKMYIKNLDFKIEEILKNTYIPYLDENKNIFELTASSKFKRNYNLFLNVFFKYYMYKKFLNCNYKDFKECFMRLMKPGDLDIIIYYKENKLNNQYNFITINDFNDDNIENLEYYLYVMEKKFPKKSDFEI